MANNPVNSGEPVDPITLADSERAELIKKFDAFDAEMDKLSPDERKQRLCANLGLQPGASEEDLQKAIRSQMFADPSFADLAGDLAEDAKREDSLISSSILRKNKKEKLDESIIQFVTNLLKKYHKLTPVERRTQILSMYKLGPDATDADLESAIKVEISEDFEGPVPEDIAQQWMKLILDTAKV